MKQVIAIHGWSGDSNTWQSWAQEFRQNQWRWKNFERGYGEIPPFTPIWDQLSDEGPHQRRVVIAHSLGLHLIKNEILEKATDVVLLCSFSRFIPIGNDSRPIKIALQGMKKHLGTDMELIMLKNFLKKACQPESLVEDVPGTIKQGMSFEGRKKLQSDLELLIQSNKLPKGL